MRPSTLRTLYVKLIAPLYITLLYFYGCFFLLLVRYDNWRNYWVRQWIGVRGGQECEIAVKGGGKRIRMSPVKPIFLCLN